MDEGMTETHGHRLALLAAVCLVAANMRPTITAVGPVLDQIGTDTGLSAATLGLVASAPLLAWAAVSPFAHDLSRRFGMSRVVLWALLLLAVGTIVRSLPGPTLGLWLGTILIGVALAIANVLMPAVVKRDFSGSVPVVMALYTALLGGFGALASGVAVPISTVEIGGAPAGWRFALLITGGVLLPVAIVVWAVVMRSPRAGGAGPSPRRRGAIWTDRVAWLVAAYMGFQSASFYMQVTWLAAIAQDAGRTEVAAGIDVMVFQFGAIAGSIALPILLRRRGGRGVPAALPVLGMAGVVGLMLAPEALIVWIVMTGLSAGASLGMSLTLMAQRARDAETASSLSGMSQASGYVVAAIGPVLFGALHTLSSGWTLPLALLLVVLLAQLIVGIFVGRPRFVFDAPDADDDRRSDASAPPSDGGALADEPGEGR